MDGQLVQVSLPSHFPLELASPVENLSPEVAELRALVHRLQAENHEFRQQAGYRKSRYRDNLKRINALERKPEPKPMIAGYLNVYFFLPHARSVPVKSWSCTTSAPVPGSPTPRELPVAIALSSSLETSTPAIRAFASSVVWQKSRNWSESVSEKIPLRLRKPGLETSASARSSCRWTSVNNELAHPTFAFSSASKGNEPRL